MVCNSAPTLATLESYVATRDDSGCRPTKSSSTYPTSSHRHLHALLNVLSPRSIVGESPAEAGPRWAPHCLESRSDTLSVKKESIRLVHGQPVSSEASALPGKPPAISVQTSTRNTKKPGCFVSPASSTMQHADRHVLVTSAAGTRFSNGVWLLTTLA